MAHIYVVNGLSHRSLAFLSRIFMCCTHCL